MRHTRGKDRDKQGQKQKQNGHAWMIVRQASIRGCVENPAWAAWDRCEVHSALTSNWAEFDVGEWPTCISSAPFPQDFGSGAAAPKQNAPHQSTDHWKTTRLILWIPFPSLRSGKRLSEHVRPPNGAVHNVCSAQFLRKRQLLPNQIHYLLMPRTFKQYRNGVGQFCHERVCVCTRTLLRAATKLDLQWCEPERNGSPHSGTGTQAVSTRWNG